VKDKLHVSIDHPITELINISIFSLHGNIVFTDQKYLNSSEIEIILPKIKSGIYILKLDGKQTSITKKIIVSK